MEEKIRYWVFRAADPGQEVFLTKVLDKRGIPWTKSDLGNIIVLEAAVKAKEGAEKELMLLVDKKMVTLASIAVDPGETIAW